MEHRGGLGPFLEAFSECAVAPTRRLIEIYVRGQLGPLPRKSVMPIALEAGVPPRTLQELLSLHRWDEGRMRDLLQQRAAALADGRPVRAAILPVAVPKKGRMTPGVDRQVPGPAARKSNCVVILHLVVAAGGAAIPLDSRVLLPRRWADDPVLRRKAGIPRELVPRTRAELALEMVDRARGNGIRFGELSLRGLDAFPPLRDRAALPVMEVPGGQAGSLPGEVGAPARAVDLLRRDGFDRVAGPEESWRIAEFPFIPAGESGALRLLVVRPESGPARFFLTELRDAPGAAELLGAALRVDDLARAFARDRADVGMDHFEVRTWRSLERHLTLSAVSLFYRSGWRGPERRSRALEA